MKSRAAILFEVGRKLEVREVDVQDPGPGEVRVQMVAGGVCHSDLHVMTGHLNAPLPAILGHEGAGIVADVGAGVTSVRPGDHVIPLWRLSCGECEFCTGGRPALCPAGTEIRWSGRLLDGTSRFKLDGEEIRHFAGVSSFSNYTVLPEKAVLKIPDDLPLERAALLGCAVITGVGAAINAARVKPGRTVAVFGVGGVGINVVQGAVLAGAEKIIAVDLMESRLGHAKQFGATHLVNSGDGDPVTQFRDLTGGRGVDYAFEAVGAIGISIGIGAWVDSEYETAPTGVLVGAVIGFAAFVLRLVRLGKQLHGDLGSEVDAIAADAESGVAEEEEEVSEGPGETPGLADILTEQEDEPATPRQD